MSLIEADGEGSVRSGVSKLAGREIQYAAGSILQ